MKLGRKQDLNVLDQVCVFRANRKIKMAALTSDWLTFYVFLLWNRLTEFNDRKQDIIVLYQVRVLGLVSKSSRHSAVSGKLPQTESGLDSWKNHEFKSRLNQKSVKLLIG